MIICLGSESEFITRLVSIPESPAKDDGGVVPVKDADEPALKSIHSYKKD